MSFSNKPIKFSLIMITVFIIIIVGISHFGLERLKSQTKEDIRETLHTVINANHETLHIWIAQRKLDISNLAKKRKLVNLTSKLINEDKRNIRAYYASTLGEIKRYLSPELEKNKDMDFYIISNKKITVASNQDDYVRKTNFIYKYNKKIMKKAVKGSTEFISIFYEDTQLSPSDVINKDWVNGYYIVSPMQDVFGAVIAVLAIRIDPTEEFSRITQLGRLGNSGETYAFNKNGVLITESRFSHQLRNTVPLSIDKENESLIRIADPGVNLIETKTVSTKKEDWPLTLMAQNATQGESGFNVDGYRDYRGVLVMGVWLWDSDLGFGLATEIDFAEGMSNYNEIKKTFIIMLSITVFLSVMLFTLIQILQKESKRKLRHAYSKLEERVIERTRELEDAKSNLTKVNKELEVLSITDGLTGISNRRNFDNHLDFEWRHCLREKMAITIIMFDIDYFKKYNDTYGHQKGDDCIKSITSMLKTSDVANRPGDLVARYGGEEFVVVLIDASVKYSSLIANKILDGVAGLKIPHETTAVDNYKFVTVSVGYAREEKIQLNKQSDLILNADEALYKAKNMGRNQVCSHSDMPVKEGF